MSVIVVKAFYAGWCNFAAKLHTTSIRTMKKTFLLALLLTMVVGMQAQTGKKILVTYFSWSGGTKALAEEIQRQTNADIYRIEPLVPYTDDYQTLAYEISNKEKEENARPALKDTLATLNDYDYIFVGCPVWWFDAPMIIHSFLECKDYNFAGKTVIPFCTFATASYETLNDIINATPNSTHLEGLGIRGSQSYTNSSTVKNWLDRIGISDIVAGITNVGANTKSNDVAYDINGFRVASMDNAPSGIYIVNGQKTIIK